MPLFISVKRNALWENKMRVNSLALFTTVYPEGVNYLKDWFSSVNYQDTSDFDIWIGCDRLSVEEAQKAMGGRIKATWVIRSGNESPIQFRERAIREMIEQYSEVVFVDSDDILEPSRVSAAQAALQHCDGYGCSMSIISEDGRDLAIEFNRPQKKSFQDILLRNNIFGLSNTAYRSEILRKCVPFPKNCVLLDWFIATRAMNNKA
ncbi:glycosyltransferase family A protein, partial [Methanoculleus sp. MH98A]|uniref:glycosyltransferase family A protein n=1 Tax=Methanoculleus sp. MH98A TaxID=1495314 RepID=UPI0018CC300A